MISSVDVKIAKVFGQDQTRACQNVHNSRALAKQAKTSALDSSTKKKRRIEESPEESKSRDGASGSFDCCKL